MQTPALRGSHATLGAALAAAGEQYGEREAYIDGAVRISYGDWITRAQAVAGLLVDRGVRPGDVVALLLPSGIDFAVCYAAVAWVGGVATGLNTRLGIREVTAILERAEPAIVIRDGQAGFPAVRWPVLERSELAIDRAGPQQPADVRPDDPAVIVWTSGTTGLPKGAWYDHRNLAAAATTAGIMSAPYDRKLVATPFAHAGYMAKLWDQIAWGTTVIVSPVPWTAAAMGRILREERVTVAGGVPTQWAKLLDDDGMRARGALPDLRVGIAPTRRRSTRYGPGCATIWPTTRRPMSSTSSMSCR